jgi:hypothetical protein
MTRAGRVVQVKHVLTAMLVYGHGNRITNLAIKAIDKIRRGFFLNKKAGALPYPIRRRSNLHNASKRTPPC